MIDRKGLISIHKLILPEAEKPSSLPFVPERDMTREDWDNIDFIFENFSPSDGYFYKVAGCLKILSPERFSKYSVPEPSDMMWDPLFEWGDDLEKDETEEAVAILFPGYFKNFDTKESIENIKKFQIGNYRLMLDEMWKLKIRKPEIVWKDLELSNKFLDVLFGYIDSSDIESIPKYIATLKAWFPQKANEIKVNPRYWKRLKANLQFFRDNRDPSYISVLSFDIYNISKYASELTMAAADRIEITQENGIELIFNKPLISDITPLPETRRF